METAQFKFAKLFLPLKHGTILPYLQFLIIPLILCTHDRKRIPHLKAERISFQ